MLIDQLKTISNLKMYHLSGKYIYGIVRIGKKKMEDLYVASDLNVRLFNVDYWIWNTDIGRHGVPDRQPRQ